MSQPPSLPLLTQLKKSSQSNSLTEDIKFSRPSEAGGLPSIFSYFYIIFVELRKQLTIQATKKSPSKFSKSPPICVKKGKWYCWAFSKKFRSSRSATTQTSSSLLMPPSQEPWQKKYSPAKDSSTKHPSGKLLLIIANWTSLSHSLSNSSQATTVMMNLL